MFGSATPVAVHPVHRANAVLRAALLSSTSPSDPSEDRQDVELLSRAIQTVMQGPVSISFPKSLAERLEALDVEDAFPSFGLPMQGAPFGGPDPLGGLGLRSGLSASDALSPEAHGLLPETLQPTGMQPTTRSIPTKPRRWKPPRSPACRRSFRKFMCRRCCTNSAAGSAMQACWSRARSRPRSCSPSAAS